MPLTFALYLSFFFFFFNDFPLLQLSALASDSFSDLHSSAAFPVSHLVPLPGCLEKAVVSSPTASHPAASTVHSSHRAVAPVALGFRELSNLPFLDVQPPPPPPLHKKLRILEAFFLNKLIHKL